MRLTNDCVNTFVSVPNIFIDKYMTNANGEFVKVYLYLLRCMQCGLDISVSTIADYCALTESDILRALIYWNKANVLALEIEEKKISGIRFLDLNTSTQKKNDLPKDVAPISVSANLSSDTTKEASSNSVSISQNMISEVGFVSANAVQTIISEHTSTSATVPQNIVTNSEFTPASKNTTQETTVVSQMRKNYTSDDIKAFRKNPDISELIFVLETYIQHTLKSYEMHAVFFWIDELKFSRELAEYLIESCVSSGHRNVRYMEMTAMNWAEEGITTIEQAKHYTSTHSKAYHSIIKEFGISGRNLGESELAYLNKWTKDYGFDADIIQEACKRTICTIQQPNFKYTDSILTNWHKQNVHTITDIANLDNAYNKTKRSSSVSNHKTNARNSFNDFPQQSYDYDELEELLLITSM